MVRVEGQKIFIYIYMYLQVTNKFINLEKNTREGTGALHPTTEQPICNTR